MPLLIVLPLLGLILGWQAWQKTSFSSAALHSLAAVVMILYLGALIGALPVSAALVLIAGAGLLVYRLWVSRDCLLTLANVPVFLLLIFSIIFWYLHGNAHYLFYDEYAHWGVYIREMLATGALWDGDTNAMHPRYPPGPALWQYLFAVYTYEADGVMYLAQFVLLVAPLLVLWERLRFVDIAWMLGIGALVIWLLANLGHGVTSLYVDHVLATWFAATLLNFMREVEQRDYLKLLGYALPLAVLPLIKDVGILLSFMATGIMGGLLLVSGMRVHRYSLTNAIRSTSPLVTLACVASLLIAFSWAVNRNAVDAKADVQSAATVAWGILGGFSVFEEDQQAEIGRRFSEVLFDQQISKSEISRKYNEFDYDIRDAYTDRYRLSTAGLMLLCAALQALIWLLFIAKQQRLRWFLCYLGIDLAVVGYLAVLYLSYQFAFGEDALRLPSYVRYAHSMLLPLVLLSVAPLLPAFRPDSGADAGKGGMAARYGSVLFAALLIAAFAFERPYIEPLYTPSGPIDVRQQLRPKAEALRALPGRPRVWVYLPVPEKLEIYARVFRLELSPLPTTVVMDPEFMQQSRMQMEAAWDGFDYIWFPLPDAVTDARRSATLGELAKVRLLKMQATPAGPELAAAGVW
ncbi:MAG: hypothetical protein QF790_01100 [Gammaproteobacteria bacterium]|jgi:hypothetical protein|nr:hypothetical protein [Gammaproteobacteria bacterium]MDP6615752.1 hypothetical protein [Gammaproteobacteria bacterium]MDP6695562.1 hypothetical protein [Gammaproteobacteria bacterium]